MPTRNTYVSRPTLGVGTSERQDFFSVSSYTLNVVTNVEENIETEGVYFPGNIAPEGYFYSPFYEVKLKDLDDEIQSVTVKRINFVPSAASVSEINVTFYDPNTGVENEDSLSIIAVESPVSYNVLFGQPFCIYDILNDTTFRGNLYNMTGNIIQIATRAVIDSDGLRGEVSGSGGQSQYIISLLEENVPEYAEFLPSSQKLVWRGPKKMSSLGSDSSLYNMPFTNGRHYIHQNVNVFLRRQDPENDYKLFRPSVTNPLRRFQIEGDGKLDFDYIQTIIDSMVDAC